MRHNDTIYASRLAAILAEHYSVDYPDAFLLRIAGKAMRNGNWNLAWKALDLFMYEREFAEADKKALNHLLLIIVDELERIAEEMQQEEELPL